MGRCHVRTFWGKRLSNASAGVSLCGGASLKRKHKNIHPPRTMPSRTSPSLAGFQPDIAALKTKTLAPVLATCIQVYGYRMITQAGSSRVF